ncbi:hypothetical protein GCM10010129_67360 [Streptomyces fumigatiscleroticus]|nr:hypothetical protein GCM10010129_67360 [Streptomyces fumigatiscleroticus]
MPDLQVCAGHALPPTTSRQRRDAWLKTAIPVGAAGADVSARGSPRAYNMCALEHSSELLAVDKPVTSHSSYAEGSRPLLHAGCRPTAHGMEGLPVARRW